MTDYQVYDQPDEPQPEEAKGPTEYKLMVEYSNQGQAKPPTLLQVFDTTYPTRELAMAAAEQCAHEFRPPDPYSPQSREVYRSDEEFITIVHGAMSSFHFTTRAVEFLGRRDE